MLYTILINKEENKAMEPMGEPIDILFNNNYWLAIEHIEYENLLSTCKEICEDCSLVDNFLINQK